MKVKINYTLILTSLFRSHSLFRGLTTRIFITIIKILQKFTPLYCCRWIWIFLSWKENPLKSARSWSRQFPLSGHAFVCLQSSVIYWATVKCHDTNTSETYVGLTENDFKKRYRNHIASFCHAKHRNSTELSKHIWTLKDSNIDHSITTIVFYHFLCITKCVLSMFAPKSSHGQIFF